MINILEEDDLGENCLPKLHFTGTIIKLSSLNVKLSFLFVSINIKMKKKTFIMHIISKIYSP